MIRLVGIVWLLGAIVPALANSWAVKFFPHGSLTAETLIGRLQLSVETTQTVPNRLKRLDIFLDGQKLLLPATALAEVTNPRLDEIRYRVPLFCSTSDCSSGPIGIDVPFDPADAKSTSACGSSLLAVTFERTGVEKVLITSCAETDHPVEKVIYERESDGA
jgi:hypothetical protein